MATRRRAATDLEVIEQTQKSERSASAYADLARVRMPEQRDPELFDPDAEIGDDILPSALQGVLTELGEADDEAKVTVKRIEVANGVRKEVWLFECHPTAFNIADVQESYGEGEYKIIVYGAQPGTKYKVIHANKKISIGPPRSGAAPKALAAVPAVTAAPQSELARALADSLAGPMMVMAKAVEGLAQQRGGSRKELLEELTVLAGIMKPAQPAGDQSSLMTAITLAEKFSGLAKGGAEIDSESGPWMVLREAVAQLGGPLAEMMRSRQAAPTAPAAGEIPAQPQSALARIQNSGGAAAAVEIMPQTNAAESDPTMLALRMQLGVLLTAAKGAADPELYGELIYQQAPDEVIEKLQSENWFEELCKLEPAFQPHKEWCAAVRKIVVDLLAEDAIAPAGAVSSNDDVSGSGKVDKA